MAESWGADTVAVMGAFVVPAVGVVKPAGCAPRVSVVVPVPVGVNVEFAVKLPAAKVSGLVTVPTAVFELVSGMLVFMPGFR